MSEASKSLHINVATKDHEQISLTGTIERHHENQQKAGSITSTEHQLEVDKQPSTDNTQQGSPPYLLLPLQTQRSEINSFLKQLEYSKHAEQLKELEKIGAIELIHGSTQYQVKYNEIEGSESWLIAKMQSELYIKFRAYQISNIRDSAKIQAKGFLSRLLKELKLPKDVLLNMPTIEEIFANDKWQENIRQFLEDQRINSKLNEKQLLEITDKLNYYYKLTEVYQGVYLEQLDTSKPYEYDLCYQDENKDKSSLAKINIDKSTNTINIGFNPLSNKELAEKRAVATMDFLTRQRERNWELELKISGFETNPTEALRIYQLAMLQGSRPKINEQTITAWKANLKHAKAELEKYSKLGNEYQEHMEKYKAEVNKYEMAIQIYNKYEIAFSDYDKARIQIDDINISKKLLDFHPIALNNKIKAVKDLQEKLRQDPDTRKTMYSDLKNLEQASDEANKHKKLQNNKPTPVQSEETTKPPKMLPSIS